MESSDDQKFNGFNQMSFIPEQELLLNLLKRGEYQVFKDLSAAKLKSINFFIYLSIILKVPSSYDDFLKLGILNKDLPHSLEDLNINDSNRELDFYIKLEKMIKNNLSYLLFPIEFIRSMLEEAIEAEDELKIKAITLFIGENWDSEKINQLGLAHDTENYYCLIEKAYQNGNFYVGDFLISLWRPLQPKDIA